MNFVEMAAGNAPWAWIVAGVVMLALELVVPGGIMLWLGVAGLAGVAATGAIIARDQRPRAQLTPEQVRDRLRDRLENGVENGLTRDGRTPGPGAPPR